MFRPYMAIIRFFFPSRFRYINCDVEISHPIIILLCLCIGGYHITFIYIYIFYIFTLCCFTSNLRIYIFYIRYELCFWLPSHLSGSSTQRGWHSLKKYTLIFVVFRCNALLKQSLPSLWNGSSFCATVGSTAGTDFFEPRVTRLVIFHKFPAHPVNDDLVHVISFLGKRRNHKRRNKASAEGGVQKAFLQRAKIAVLTDQCAQAHCYNDRP